MEAKDMTPTQNVNDGVSIPVQEENEGSSNTASNQQSSSPPSNKIAGFNSTSTVVSVFEWILVLCAVAGLIVGLILAGSDVQKEVVGEEVEQKNKNLKPAAILWRCCIVVLVIVCGRHFMGWMMMRVKNSLAKGIFNFFKGSPRYSYYIYGLRKSVGVFLWFVLILVTWYLLLDTSDELKKWSGTEIRNFIRRNLITLVIVGALWVVKTFLVNKLSSSFQVTSSFDWIRSSLINQYILQVFDRSPMPVAQNLINKLDRGKEYPGVICRLRDIDPKEVSAWTMEDFIDSIRSNELSSSITKKLENLVDDEDFRAKLEYEDTVPKLLNAAVCRIFDNIYRGRDSHNIDHRITENDLIELLKVKKEEATAMIQQINGQMLVPRFDDNPSVEQMNEVSCEALKMWLMHATVQRKTLARSINDGRSAIKELNDLFSSIVLFLLVVIWSLMVGLLTQDGLVLILSQIFVFTFIFGNTAKTAFEGIVFVFVKHPFDIGDRCLINREEVVVERISLFTTIFRKEDKHKVFYSNSVLSTMPITNFYRPKGNFDVRDSLEFTTKWPIELDGGINSLRDHIEKRLRQARPENWFLKCDLVVKELEDEKKAKMVLSVTYCSVNVHKSGVRRRHELIIALNQLLRDLNIEHYKIRPQEVDSMKNTANPQSPQEVDSMKNTANPQSTQETNQQSNESKCEASTSEVNKDTADYEKNLS